MFVEWRYAQLWIKNNPKSTHNQMSHLKNTTYQVQIESYCHESILEFLDPYPPKATHRSKFPLLVWSKKSFQGLGGVRSKIADGSSTCCMARGFGCCFLISDVKPQNLKY